VAETTILDERGRVVSRSGEVPVVTTAGEHPGTFLYRSSLRLSELPPGAYVLRLAATPGGAAQDATPKPGVRQIAFRVWPPPNAQATGGGVPADPIVTVTSGAVSGVAAPETVVARNSSEWLSLWGRLPLKRTPPAVTFDNTMIVAVFLGARPTAGYAVQITGTRLDGDTLTVEFAEQAPPETASNPPMETTPFVVAGVRRHDGPIRFEKVPR
jgi:hypothetical protein